MAAAKPNVAQTTRVARRRMAGVIRKLVLPLFVIALAAAAFIVADQSLRRRGKVPTITGWTEASRNADTAVELTPIVSGLANPIYLTHAGDDSERLFVVEQRGKIRVIENGELLEQPFLDISERLAGEDWEQGLLSVAFHPDYQSNGRFFIAYTAVEDGRVVLGEHVVSDDPNIASAEEASLLEVAQPSPQHNGGQLQFGPDGYLYLGLGDGEIAVAGSGRHANRLDSLLGKILRLDVSEPGRYRVPADNPFVGRNGAQPEIWAYGLRNPWRFSFDRDSGEAYVGDVGECCIEEISLLEAGGNHGWPSREGSVCRTPTLFGWIKCHGLVIGQRLVPPLVEYGHIDRDPSGGQSVTGGYVYRYDDGSALMGRYLFADFLTGRVWSLERQEDGGWVREELLDSDYLISSFGEDEQGRVYLMDWQSGTVFLLGMAQGS